MALRLRYNERSIVLPAGQLVIGRSPDCHIVSTDPLASRKHAVVTMGKSGAFVTDLGSKSGVRVNSEAIVGARRLSRGDQISIAGVHLIVDAVTFEEEEPTDPRLRSTISPPANPSHTSGAFRLTPPLGIPRITRGVGTSTVDDPGANDPSDDDDDALGRTQQGPASGPTSSARRVEQVSLTSTQEAPRVSIPDSIGRRAGPVSSSRGAGALPQAPVPKFAPPPSFPREGTLRALAAMGEKAIALGRPDEAERILQRALFDTLEAARRGETDASTAEIAASLAARIAAATTNGKWFDYAVAVYAARGDLAPATIVDLLYSAAHKVRNVDKALFREYLASMRALGSDSPARRFVVQRLEGLQGIVDLK